MPASRDHAVVFARKAPSVRAPDTGKLYPTGRPTRELYVPNGAVHPVDTQVTVTVPKDVVVRIRGVARLEHTGLHLSPVDIYGPTTTDIKLVLHNGSHAGVQLREDEPVAEVRAEKAPALVKWTEATVHKAAPPEPAKANDEAPETAAKDLMA